MSSGVNENRVPISEKTILTVQECSALTGIGQNTLDAALDMPDCPFCLRIGRKKLIIRDVFDEYIKKYRKLRSAVAKDDESDPLVWLLIQSMDDTSSFLTGVPSRQYHQLRL